METKTIKSPKKRLIALLLSGTFIGHRLYVGKVGSTFLYLITLGGLGMWWMLDVFMILIGSFTDKSGHFVSDWI